MKITSTITQTTHYVQDGLVPYKVVQTSWSPEPVWRAGKGDKWVVYGSQGIHRYERQCDENKATHKRVVAAVQQMLGGPTIGNYSKEVRGGELVYSATGQPVF